ncbi:histidine kinase [Massilia violaceinigra]|uniref:Histidine kinase n=1 Tax=Massilia violaceinigra TaxID=2045208 RepID=A0A2D2DS95_9BURK|nr:cache domain-containing protein [Massilia violaceinigra]ATQ77838.1 histidine kinase [Massilia violaceinigra]
MSILPTLRVRILLPLAICYAVALPATADPFVTKAEAEAVVKKTVAYMKTNGRDKTYSEINRKDAPFTDRDLYITVYGTDGVVRAHGANLKMLNRNLMDIKDVDGKEFVRERIELAKKNAPFWQEYKFTNSLSKKTEPKAMYCQPYEEVVVCGGVYIK